MPTDLLLIFFLLFWTRLHDVTNGKTIAKRQSLVSRFTSNPFFLSHFDHGYHEPYVVENSANEENENFFTWHYEDNTANEASNLLIEENENNSEEEEEEDDIVVHFSNGNPFDSTNNSEETPIFNISQSSKNNEETGPIFRILPHFDIATPFNQNKNLQIFNSFKNKFEEKEEIGPIFKILPHFDIATPFHQNKNLQIFKLYKNNFEEAEIGPIFKILPHFDITTQFRNQMKKDTIFIFKSLPHFDKSEQFRPSKRRKLVKVIRRKLKIPGDDVDKVETGIGKIENIADLPLEDFDVVKGDPFNSYGGLLSPKSM